MKSAFDLPLSVVGTCNAAMAAFLGYFALLLARERCHRQELEIEPPDRAAFLRPPGHFLQEQLDRLRREQDEVASSAFWDIAMAGLASRLWWQCSLPPGLALPSSLIHGSSTSVWRLDSP